MTYATNDFLKDYCPFATADIEFLVGLMNKFDVKFHEIYEYVIENKNDDPANIYDINVYIESCYKVMIDNVYRWVNEEVDINEFGDEYNENDRLLSYIASSKDEIEANCLASRFDNNVVNKLFELSKESGKLDSKRVNEQVRYIMATYM
jgi:hypothetical protein